MGDLTAGIDDGLLRPLNDVVTDGIGFGPDDDGLHLVDGENTGNNSHSGDEEGGGSHDCGVWLKSSKRGGMKFFAIADVDAGRY